MVGSAARQLVAPLQLGEVTHVAQFTFFEESDNSLAVENELLAACRTGELPRELPEGAHWVPRAKLDFAAMPADDVHWYPRVLDGELLSGAFSFGAPQELVSHEVRALNKLVLDDSSGRVLLPSGDPVDDIRYVG